MSNWPITTGSGSYQAVEGLDQDFRSVPVVASATVNTVGPWVQLIASVKHSTRGFWLVFGRAQGDSGRYLVDIAIGASGSEVIVGDGIPIGIETYRATSQSVFLPIGIPAGSRVSMRAQSSVASGRLDVTGSIEHSNLMSPVGGARVLGLNANRATTTGTAVPPGYGGGTITELVASTSQAFRAILLGSFSDPADESYYESLTVRIFVGASGSEMLLIPPMNFFYSIKGVTPSLIGPFPVSVPAGSRLSAQVWYGRVGPSHHFLILGVP